MKNFLLTLYRFFWCRTQLVSLNQHLYKLSLRSIGVLNSEGETVTGEADLLERLRQRGDIRIIFDVGANHGTYTQLLRQYFPQGDIYALEPHPHTFQLLKKNTRGKHIHIFNLGCSNTERKAQLWDFAADAEMKATQPTSTLASLHKAVITDIHGQKAQSFAVQLTTLDAFTRQQKIDHIDFLQIDTEGHELAVLQGARRLLKEKKIRIIQFEFNEMHVLSRTFVKDFMDVLPDYHFYRLLPDGLLSLQPYQPKLHEIFAFQNIVAMSPEIAVI